MSRIGRRTFTVLLASTLLGIGGAAAARVSAAPLTYVSLGDSYTSGPVIPVQIGTPRGCARSNHNYPHDVAAALGLKLTDVSCSGATTANMAGSQSVSGGTNPPQLNALNSATSRVTLGIGGNDIGFSSIISNCLAQTASGPTRVGPNCRDYYLAGGDQIAAAIRATAPKVTRVLQAIHRLAPHARVLVIGYPAILPVSGGGCFPQMPFVNSDIPYLRAKEVQLNQMLAQVASANGATYVDTYTPSATHNACTPESSRWIEPVSPSAPAAPVHPNAAGEAGMATAVRSALAA